MIFVKAMKSIAFSIATLPLGGCAIAIALIFGSLLRPEAYAPDINASLFNKAMLGFTLVETYLVVIMFVIGIIFIF